MSLERIAQGIEHNVYVDSEVPNQVFKVPRFAQKVLTTAEGIQNELDLLTEAAPEAGVVIPETTITPFPSRIKQFSSYIVSQEFVGNDGTCGPDLQAEIDVNELEKKLPRYSNKAQNYGCREGNLYILDTTIGFMPRIVERSKIMSAETYRTIRRRMKKRRSTSSLLFQSPTDKDHSEE